ncbi:MAG: glutamine synthetase family protein [Candidatus Omnitrophica bacterium]|nr:glutamine synthetase family protein [Candidatus Omnitrophota bacterium]MBU4488243.1 glutamine synthetase family protein [Candidatus Omnitrophota bacterium]MCG2704691.1 glutamine synthetase family protein [Candidatus Omnitrophota bacterium]
MKTKKEVISFVKKHKITNIQLWFTDILGGLKCCVISDNELEGALDHGKGFDGSSVAGYAEAEESDILAMPDISTFKIVPWESKKEPVARMFCDILTPEKKPYPGDPRYALKRNLAKAKKMGFDFYVGPELEYFYFKRNDKPEILDEGGYFDLVPNDVANELRKDTVKMLDAIGINVETSHHECAPSQHEIDLRYADALTMADTVMTYKMVVKEVAQRRGYHATFMPKPIFGVAGSGMHTHQSLFSASGGTKGKNAFFDKKDKHHLSKIAKHFIAGELKHAREICAITAQWVNSYKRLVPGYEAPVYISWATKNRTALIRVPVYRPGNEKATRAELRCPDPACNPYLAFSVMLAAGLEGIEKKYKLPEPIEPNLYKMEMEERDRKGVKSLPIDLFEAIKETEKSRLVKDALGEHIFKRFLHNKIKEWEEYRIQVTSQEIKKYLPIL